jgi:diguanylate cyclase (GGDEF)-like protein/PAS domain S-box-containing protein
VTLFYLLLSGIWIVVSDGIVYLHGGMVAQAAVLSLIKGLSFVVVTGAALYFFMTRFVHENRRENEVLSQRLTQLTKYVNDIVLLFDENGRLIEANDRAESAYGFPREILLGLPVAKLRVGERDWREDWKKVQSLGHVRFEAFHRRADGSIFPVDVSARRIDVDGRRLVQSIVRDTSDRQEAERQIVRLKDVYAALSQTNQCIVRCSNREELFKSACKIAVQYGHFRMAWIGLVDVEKKTVVPVEWAGEDTDYLQGLQISIDPNSLLSTRPAGQAVLSAKYQILNDFAKSMRETEWYDRIHQYGLNSCGSFPLFTKENVVGVLTLYSGDSEFFTQDLIDLLDEMALDITYALDRLEAEKERRRLEFELAKLSMAVEQSPVTVVITDLDGNIQFVNPAFTATSGYTKQEALGQNPRIISSGEKPKSEYAEMWERIKAGYSWQGLFHNRKKDGSLYWEEAVITPVRDTDGLVKQFIGIKHDVTKRVEAEENLAFLAHYDPLTNLPNRLLGRDRMERAIVNADRHGSKAALLILDIDHFKRVNDSLGHAVGDMFLKAVVERLRGCIRDSDTFSRQGGDEFLVILSAVDDSEAINRVAANILERMIPSFSIGGLELSATVSIGISVYPDDGGDFDSLFRRADTAMYQAKEAGRNTYRFFAERMNIDANEYLQILNGLRRAVDLGEFVLHYQPQISLATNQVIGAEALIRWNHPDLGLVPPGRFISIAEDSGLIVEIGEWVLREACRQMMVWRDGGLCDVVVAVNLSAVQFRRGGLLKGVSQALRESGLPPSCLELELTESILIKDTENVLSTVKQLKALGVRLSIDDFGTGYSSLAYLRRFDLDKLKIDQSFVRDIAADPNNDTIVKAIVQLAQGLGLKTIAEGVEDLETLDVIRRHGCDEVQGFHFAKPMAPEQFTAYQALIAMPIQAV